MSALTHTSTYAGTKNKYPRASNLSRMFTTQTKETFQTGTEVHETQSEISQEALVDKYQLNDCIKWISENQYEKTCLQFPEELLNDGASSVLYIQEKLNKTICLLGDTSYGSCCVDEVSAEHVNADSIIHFGHACLSPVIKLPVHYVFLKEDFNVNDLSCKLSVFPDEDPVVLFYDDVHNHLYPQLRKVFEDKKNVSVSSLKTGEVVGPIGDKAREFCGRVFSPTADKDVSAVYIGSEKSRTLENLVLNLPDFKWYRYDHGNDELKPYELNRNRFLMKRMALVEKVKAAETIGILIATLGIKNYLDAIERIKSLVKRHGKKCYKLAVGKPNVAKLANFPEIDVFVCISCQENSLLKDFTGYYKPVVSLMEVELALGGREYGLEYTSNFRDLLPGGSFHNKSNYECELTEKLHPNHSEEKSQELVERNAGTVAESSGAHFLMARTWRGLEQRIGETEVRKAVKGRSGIPQAYENEVTTLSADKPASGGKTPSPEPPVRS